MPEHSLTGVLGYFLRRWRVSVLLMIGLALSGSFAAVTLPRESTPEVEIPVASVVTAFPGASARDVEELVTEQVEERVEATEGVEEVTSSSRLGLSVVTVEFAAEENVDQAIRRLRDDVSQLDGLPANAEDPDVVEISFENEPILTIALGGVSDERLLTLLADDLADDISTIQGVSDVRVVGGRTEEISVRIDPERLAEAGISIGQVVNALNAANANIPVGQIETEGFAYDVRIKERFTDASDAASVHVTGTDGVSIPLDELATVRAASEDINSRARVSIDGNESSPAITLQVTKKTGGNIIEIVDEVNERIDEQVRSGAISDVTIETFADRADDIRTSLRDVTRSGVQTLIIVFAVLWAFLGWREAGIAALAIPLTFSIAFLVFEYADITLNNISLFSLILSLGLLVDNAIVVTEGIHTGVGGPGLREHAMGVVRRFQKPLIGGTLTTVAAFVPMLLVSGIIGQFLRTIPIVLTATLLSSLFVALAFIPVVAVQTLNNQRNERAPRRFDRWFGVFRRWYNERIGALLVRRRAQNVFIGALVGLLLIGFTLPFIGVLQTGLFPAVDADFMIINVELPSGSTLEKTSRDTERVEHILQDEPAIKSYVLNLGASSSIDVGGSTSSENLASFSVNLKEDREETSIQLTRRLRTAFSDITEADVTVEEISAGPPTAPPIELRVIGSDLDALTEASRDIMDELEQINGAIDIDRDLRFSAGEFTFSLDEKLLAEHGLAARDVGGALRSFVFGTEATSFLGPGGDEIPVRVQASDTSVNSISDIRALSLITQQGERVRVGQLGTVELNTSVSAIRRRGGERTITVTADSDGNRAPNTISAELQRRLEDRALPGDTRLEFGGEQQETEETFADLYRSMVVAVLLIIVILVIEFDSYKQPFLVFLTIPLALIGVLFGLVLLGGQLNFAAFIGLVSLTGIVVNNAIILVDRMNVLVAEGVDAVDAVRRAADARLRPVILTTLTTTLGVIPLIWVDAFFRDLALALITGLIFSSILTLVFIPVLYVRMRKREKARLGRTE